MTYQKDSNKEDDKNFEKSLHFNNNISLEPMIIQEEPTKGQYTDNRCFVIFIILLICVIPLTVIFSKGTDINRFMYGSDKCGDTCGIINDPVKYIKCSGKNLTNKRIAMIKYRKTNPLCPFSRVKIIPDKCVEECNPPNQLIFRRCYPPTFALLNNDSKNMKKLATFLHIIEQNLSVITLLSFGGIVLTFTLLMCLRYNVAVTFWILATFQLMIFMTGTVYLWHKYLTCPYSEMFYFIAALGTTVYILFLIFFLIFFRSSFGLVFALYEEGVNTIFKIPLILIQPLMTLTVLVIMVALMIFLIFLICSNKYLKPTLEDPTSFEYFSTIPVLSYICYVIFITMWMYSFVEGCHFMIISGMVKNYYFARDKSNVRSPFLKSVRIMLHHLGTIASGSLVVTIMTVVRSVAEYMVNKAYTETVLHGTKFTTSTTRSMKLICSHLLNAIAIAGFNYVVINGFSFLAILLTMFAGIWLNSECIYSYYTWMGLVFGAFGACLVTLFMMSVVNITTETIFFCFCEDQISNDGENRPYYMSERLKGLMNKCKEIEMKRLNQINDM